MHTFLAPAWLACAFLARVLRIARASLDRVLSGTRSASLCSYREGSYKAIFTVLGFPCQRTPWLARGPSGLLLLQEYAY